MKQPFTPWSNRSVGSIQKAVITKLPQELVDQAYLAFPERDLSGDETMLELGIIEGQKKVLKWLQRMAVKEAAVTNDVRTE